MSEDGQSPSSSKVVVNVQKVINIDQTKNLDGVDNDTNKVAFSGPGQLELHLLDGVSDDSEGFDNEVEHVLHSFMNWFPAQLPPYVSHQLSQRKIYRPSGATHEPKTTRPLQSPWAQLSTGTVVSQTRSKRGNSNLIAVQDLYTKYIESFPVRHRTGKSLVKALETIFDLWGDPKVNHYG